MIMERAIPLLLLGTVLYRHYQSFNSSTVEVVDDDPSDSNTYYGSEILTLLVEVVKALLHCLPLMIGFGVHFVCMRLYLRN
mmetsp:Transcript_12483/g.34661  ORF Transcript_12483/g.34661 Transcript_12483/m.34661 type:complete len:81 (-) Transcript_12483:308-550(-)